MKSKCCKNPECKNLFTPRYSALEKYCSYQCANKMRKPKKPSNKINPLSKKRAKQNRVYSKERKIFLSKPENSICFVSGCGKRANTIEHQKGRKGFADDYARNNNIPLLLDQRFWKPCCLKHNLAFESDPELSKAYQLSQIHQGKKI